MERFSKERVVQGPETLTLTQIQEKYDALNTSETNKTVKFLGKKKKRQTSKSEIQKMIDTVRKKATTDEMIKPVLQSLKYDLEAAGTDVLAELSRLRFKLKKLGLGKELCTGQLKTFLLASQSIGDNGAFVTDDLFFYVVLLYEKLNLESRKMIDSIESVYICNSSELFLNEKNELQEFFYEDTIPDASACGNLSTSLGNSIKVSIKPQEGMRMPGVLNYKGKTYLYESVNNHVTNKPMFLMAEQSFWKINKVQQNIDNQLVTFEQYDLNIPAFKLFHISKELKSGVKRVGKKKGLFIIGSKITPTNVATKNLLLDCDASFEYLVTGTINKSYVLNFISNKNKITVPDFLCNMENLLILIELTTLSGFMYGVDMSNILANYKQYYTAFTLYRKLYTKIMSVICNYFDWFIEKVNYDKIIELKRKIDDTLSFWEEIGTTNVENYLREWVTKLLTCDGAYALESQDNLILNFFTNLNELRSMLLKTRTIFTKIIDFSVDAEVIESHLRALAVGYRRFMMNGSLKCFTIIRTTYAFMGNTIGNSTLADLVDELNKMKVETYKSSTLLAKSELENIRNEMAIDFANLMKVTEGLDPKQKTIAFANDTIIPAKLDEALEINMATKNLDEINNVMSEIFNIYNTWSTAAGKEKKPKKIKIFKKSLGRKKRGDSDQEETTYNLKDTGIIKSENGATEIVDFVRNNLQRGKIKSNDAMLMDEEVISTN